MVGLMVDYKLSLKAFASEKHSSFIIKWQIAKELYINFLFSRNFLSHNLETLETWYKC